MNGSLRPLVVAALLSGCRSGEPLQEVADTIAREQGVPTDLLLAVSFSESRLSAPGDGELPPGLVKLTSARASRDPRRAARLLGLAETEKFANRRANLRAAAALLADAARTAGVARDAPSADWRPALERFNGGDD